MKDEINSIISRSLNDDYIYGESGGALYAPEQLTIVFDNDNYWGLGFGFNSYVENRAKKDSIAYELVWHECVVTSNDPENYSVPVVSQGLAMGFIVGNNVAFPGKIGGDKLSHTLNYTASLYWPSDSARIVWARCNWQPIMK